MDKIQELESSERKVTKFSVTGYSLGGLVGRYLLGLVLPCTVSLAIRADCFSYACSILYQRGFFETVTPVNFHSIATPHLGLPRVPSLRSAILSSWAPRLSRTGEQLYCTDKWGTTGRPLLQVMADPGMQYTPFMTNLPQLPLDRIFYRALALFPYISLYANALVVHLQPC